MATSVDQIRQWCLEAKDIGRTHLAVFCDDFSHEDYPVATTGSREYWVEQNRNRNGDRHMETYDLLSPLEPQLQEHRAYHPPEKAIR